MTHLFINELCHKPASFGLGVKPKNGRLAEVAPGSFTDWLRKQAIDPAPMQGTVRCTPAEDSPMKKWACGCTNVRAATPLNAVCLTCGEHFEVAGSAMGGKK
jgi:hypothetical protein